MRVNSTGVKGEDDVVGFRRPLPGRYHVVVKHVDDTFQKRDGLIVEFEVLAGTVPGQEGLTLEETMWLRDGNSTDQHLRFALVTGLIQPGTEADVNFTHAVGRQLVVAVEKKKGKDGNEYTNIADYGMSMWRMDNPEVRDVPKLPPPGQGNGQPTPAPMPQYQSPPPAQYQQPPQQQYAPPAAQQAPQQPTQQPAPQQSGGWGDI